jgi:hyperosmotically inducible periplasmic protein
MTSMHPEASRLRRTVLVAASLVLLAACGKPDDRTVGQKVDAAVDTAEQKTAVAASRVAEKLDDAAITTALNAELAKDPTLSALSINVDTAVGVVTLRGTAPSAVARERASTLAMGIKGVHRVDNQLVVKE